MKKYCIFLLIFLLIFSSFSQLSAITNSKIESSATYEKNDILDEKMMDNEIELEDNIEIESVDNNIEIITKIIAFVCGEEIKIKGNGLIQQIELWASESDSDIKITGFKNLNEDFWEDILFPQDVNKNRLHMFFLGMKPNISNTLIPF